MIEHWQGLLQIVGCIIWFIGAIVSIEDYANNGKSLKKFRKKYGHDLGLLLFIWNVVLRIIFWFPFLILSFVFGLIRDTFRLIMPAKKVEDNEQVPQDS